MYMYLKKNVVTYLLRKYLGVPDMKQESVGNSVDVLLFFLENFLGQKNMYFCRYLTVPAKTNNPELFFLQESAKNYRLIY